MKNTYKIILILFLFSFSFSFAQLEKDWKTMSKTERQAALENMTSDQKMHLLQNIKQNMMLEELNIPEKDKQKFNELYLECQNNQRKIKNAFEARTDYENLTDEEAVKELNASFDVGQKLLDTKRECANKFLKIMRPQQVLQMFENEGRMRSKVRDRKDEIEKKESESRSQNENSRSKSNDDSRVDSSSRRR